MTERELFQQEPEFDPTELLAQWDFNPRALHIDLFKIDRRMGLGNLDLFVQDFRALELKVYDTKWRHSNNARLLFVQNPFGNGKYYAWNQPIIDRVTKPNFSIYPWLVNAASGIRTKDGRNSIQVGAEILFPTFIAEDIVPEAFTKYLITEISEVVKFAIPLHLKILNLFEFMKDIYT